jgi:hypothetical protein
MCRDVNRGSSEHEAEAVPSALRRLGGENKAFTDSKYVIYKIITIIKRSMAYKSYRRKMRADKLRGLGGHSFAPKMFSFPPRGDDLLH